MLVSTKGRYALRVIIDLAEREGEGYLPLRDVAHRLGISEKYLESVLKTLVRDHLIEGMRGKGGGYRLTRPAADYTVGEVLRATEGSLAPVAGLDNEEAFRIEEPRCHGMWEKLDVLIEDYLDGVKVTDLCVSTLVGNDYVI
ncbi:RrF2 family transcriptional regulator [Parolsenella sp. LCP21S3_E11]|uniref:RrF2 family transcriptional regulator n=1 Tax=Parolsenella sp. LCP21S3_E11 TaxID=3438797 RepID=UPI003F9B114D